MPALLANAHETRGEVRHPRCLAATRPGPLVLCLLTGMGLLAAGCGEDPAPPTPATPREAPADHEIAVVLARSPSGFELEIRGRADDLRASLELPPGLRSDSSELPFATDGAGRRALFHLHGQGDGPITITVIGHDGGRRQRRVSVP